MPELNAIIVDWEVAAAFDEQGTLSDELFSEASNEHWVVAPDAWEFDSGRDYLEFINMLDELIPHVESVTDEIAGALRKLFMSPICDLKCKINGLGAFSPDTVSSIALPLSKFSASDFESAFNQYDSEKLDRFHDFKDDFESYLVQWLATVAEAEKIGWALFVFGG